MKHARADARTRADASHARRSRRRDRPGAPGATLPRAMNARIQRRIGMQQRGDARKSGVRIGSDQRGHRRFGGRAGVEDHRAGARVLELRDVLRIGEEGDRTRVRPATAKPPNPRSAAGSPRSSQPKRTASSPSVTVMATGALRLRLRAWRAASAAPLHPRRSAPASARAPAAPAAPASVMSTVGVA